MGFMDQLKKIARPYAEDEDEEYDDDYTPAASPDPQPARREAATPRYRFSSQNDTAASTTATERTRDKVVPMSNQAQQQVVLMNTISYENATTIADHLASRHIVLLNLESTPKDVARRIIDFLSGVTYALDGKLRKVAVSTFILTPSNVDISGELLEELESNGLYL